jgi:hypothetical protein
MALQAKQWILYHIKKVNRDGEEKTYFDRVGRGYVNKNGSFNLYLETLPVGMDNDTVFNFQEYKPKETKEAESFIE